MHCGGKQRIDAEEGVEGRSHLSWRDADLLHSRGGALLEVESPAGLPRSFVLVVPSDNVFAIIWAADRVDGHELVAGDAPSKLGCHGRNKRAPGALLGLGPHPPDSASGSSVRRCFRCTSWSTGRLCLFCCFRLLRQRRRAGTVSATRNGTTTSIGGSVVTIRRHLAAASLTVGRRSLAGLAIIMKSRLMEHGRQSPRIQSSTSRLQTAAHMYAPRYKRGRIGASSTASFCPPKHSEHVSDWPKSKRATDRRIHALILPCSGRESNHGIGADRRATNLNADAAIGLATAWSFKLLLNN